jgi:dihydroorotate dehydrogenase electron transfer subunit
MKQRRVKILGNIKLGGKYFKLSFVSPPIAKEAKPGQFLEIRVNEGAAPFLRKPLGIHSVKGAATELLYEVVGGGTRALSEKGSDETLDVIGPLGNGFSSQFSVLSSQPILVAGGIGVAPLMFLAQKLAKRKPIILIGARTKKDILCDKEFKDLGCEVRIATDDGSKGYKGFVTDLLKNVGAPFMAPVDTGFDKSNPYVIYTCGPKPMMKAVTNIAARHRVPCQVLLEEYMACGVGVCLGCPVMTKDGYKMVCRDGPVFEAGEIIW